MPRPFCPKKVDFSPTATYFKPAGVPMRFIEEVVLSIEEFEALRLADLQGFYHEQAAEKMRISRPTFSRLIEQARKKVADAIVNGKALKIEGKQMNSSSPANQNFLQGGGHRRFRGEEG